MIIRNDDVSVDTQMSDFYKFCEICDRRGFKILQGITICGETHKIDYRMDNNQIKSLGPGRQIFEHTELIDYLVQRNDLIAVHGLWHTHEVTEKEIESAKRMLTRVLKPTYFIPPFNEGDYPNEICGLRVSSKDAQNIEHYFQTTDIPTTEIAYTHFWRYGRWYPWETLEKTLDRIVEKMIQS
jgi:hypothetical protein